MSKSTFPDPTSSDPTSDHLHRFAHDHYQLRRQFFKLFGGAFHIRDAQDNLVLYSKQKSFKLKEDISLYDDEAMTTQLLHITTQSILDIAGSYAVKDATNGELIGAIKRRGLSSTFVRDEWLLLDPAGQEIGRITEDAMWKSLLRRFVDLMALLLPQAYHITMDGQEVGIMKQRFNLFLYKLDIDFSNDTHDRLDPRLGLAAAVLLAAIEGKQS